MGCCLPTCAQGSSVSVTEFVGNGAAWGFLVLFGSLLKWEVLALLVYSSDEWDLGYAGMPIAGHALWAEVGGVDKVPYMLASAGQPSLHGNDACMVNRTKGHSGKTAGKNTVRYLFTHWWVFLLCRNSRQRFWGVS